MRQFPIGVVRLACTQIYADALKSLAYTAYSVVDRQTDRQTDSRVYYTVRNTSYSILRTKYIVVGE